MSFEKICKKYGGLRVYIPQVIPDVRERIIEEFNGYNYELLATKFNLSLEKVREIIREYRKREEKLPLFKETPPKDSRIKNSND